MKHWQSSQKRALAGRHFGDGSIMPVCSRLVWKVCEELEKCFWRGEKVKEGQVRQVEGLASMSELSVLRRKKKKPKQVQE